MKQITMKKALVFLALGTACLFTACSSPEDASLMETVTGVSLDKTELALTVGKTANLNPTILPNTAVNKKVSWVSSDSSIATVNNGRITAVDLGTATITVTTEDGSFTAQCKITVGADPEAIRASGVSLNQTKLTLSEGDTEILTATVEPEEAAYKSVTWVSGDNGIAVVDKDGFVTAIAVGEATITVTTKDGGFTAECAVTVVAADPNNIAVTGVSLNKTALTLKMEETETLHASVEPEEATNRNVIWSSSNAAVASVDADGVVTAVALGTATITVTTQNGGKKAECSVTVNPIPVDRVELENKSVEKNGIQPPIFLTASVYPPNATNKNIRWSSSDDAVAIVEAASDGRGQVTFVGSGSATITVTTEDGEKTATCSITVKPVPLLDVTLKDTLPLFERESATLEVTFNPWFATDKRVTWASSNNNVVKVDENGLVTAIAEGTATVTVTALDGNKTATCNVTVEIVLIPVTGVTLDKGTVTLFTGETGELTATVKPDDATNNRVTWSSSNDAVAEVDVDGVVTGKTPGTATITATTNDRGFTADCIVTVNAVPVDSVTLDITTLNLIKGDTQKLTAEVKPGNATNKSITWSSSAPAVASIANDGTVTATGAGTATITVTTADGSKKATCAVTVKLRTYTVSFVGTTGVTAPPSLTVNDGDNISAPPTPTLSGYDVILEWREGSTSGSKWDFANGKVTKDITLYAYRRPYELGETGPGGGKIFYRTSTGFDFYTGSTATDNSNKKAYYLEAAPNDVVGNFKWSTRTFSIPMVGEFFAPNLISSPTSGGNTAIGTGLRNTNMINKEGDDPVSNPTAAGKCSALPPVNDWFLPSKDELEQLRLNRDKAGNISADVYYWSSSQDSTQAYGPDNANFAWAQIMKDGSGTQKNESKEEAYKVRPIRAF